VFGLFPMLRQRVAQRAGTLSGGRAERADRGARDARGRAGSHDGHVVGQFYGETCRLVI